MRYDEFLASQAKQRKPLAHEEHDRQVACVSWYRLQYPQYALNMFSVPNGGYRTRKVRHELMEEGTVQGVSDLILMLRTPLYGALCIEMKSDKGKQRDSQKMWQKAVEGAGYKYVVCRSIDEFSKIVNDYIQYYEESKACAQMHDVRIIAADAVLCKSDNSLLSESENKVCGKCGNSLRGVAGMPGTKTNRTQDL